MDERAPQRRLNAQIRALLGLPLAGPIPAKPDAPRRQRSVDLEEITALLGAWPPTPRGVARQLIARYGVPHEATHARLYWFDHPPWNTTVLRREILRQQVPATAADLWLSQCIGYPVPPHLAADLKGFGAGGRLELLPDTAEVIVRGPSEAANFITMNLLHDVARGTRGIEEAQLLRAVLLAEHACGHDVAYARRLNFSA